jgi:hypothetical protein
MGPLIGTNTVAEDFVPRAILGQKIPHLGLGQGGAPARVLECGMRKSAPAAHNMARGGIIFMSGVS